MKEKIDKRILKTKSKLKTALLSLLEKQSLSTISVTKLCSTAKVDRNTFYCYYDIPEDLITEILIEHEKQIIDYISQTAPVLNYREMLYRVCDYMYKTKKLYTLLFKNGFDSSYLQRITDASNNRILEIFKRNGNINLSFEELQFVNRYATGGTTLIIQDWVLNGMKETPEQISNKLNGTNTFILNHYFNYKPDKKKNFIT